MAIEGGVYLKMQFFTAAIGVSICLVIPSEPLNRSTAALAATTVESVFFPGDANGDGQVDLRDVASWPTCETGPGGGPLDPGCTPLDMDTDSDLDLYDFFLFLEVFRDPICGNGIPEAGEGCDDGNNEPGDGCRSDCSVEECGDGIIDAAEQCDDGGETASCDSDCTFSSCGDGTRNVSAGESCDDAGESQQCDVDCTTAVCGDATVNATAGEACDDAGESFSCDADCTAAECGDGTVNTSAGEACDDAGESLACDADCTFSVCGDLTVNNTAGEECDDGSETALCDADCTLVECGDGELNTSAGEVCDDGNQFNGDGCRIDCTPEVCGDDIVDPNEDCDPPDGVFCGNNCKFIISGLINDDNCGDANSLSGEGIFSFNSFLATQDGPPHTACVFFQDDQIGHDVWGCWTSPCDGTVLVDTCGFTTVDTKIAVYDSCSCPVNDARLLTCNDDVCGGQSRAAFEAVSGGTYLIRLGTFPPRSGGFGLAKITCGVDVCPAAGDCSGATGNPGCSDEACCETICARDPFCCEVEWDELCVEEGSGFCGAGFTACEAGAGGCTSANGTPGCEDVECCNAVCRADPACCLDGWDSVCAEAEAAYCHSSCGPGAGACHEANGTPGCEDPVCCDEVCLRDPFCCQTGWDLECVPIADQWCSGP